MNTELRWTTEPEVGAHEVDGRSPRRKGFAKPVAVGTPGLALRQGIASLGKQLRELSKISKSLKPRLPSSDFAALIGYAEQSDKVIWCIIKRDEFNTLFGAAAQPAATGSSSDEETAASSADSAAPACSHAKVGETRRSDDPFCRME